VEEPCGLGGGSLSRRGFDDMQFAVAPTDRPRSRLVSRSEDQGDMSYFAETFGRAELYGINARCTALFWIFHICCVGRFSFAGYRPPCSLPCQRYTAADSPPSPLVRRALCLRLPVRMVERPLLGSRPGGLECIFHMETMLQCILRF